MTTAESKLRAKGLKFAPTPSRIPKKEIIIGVEELAMKMEAVEADELRSEVREFLKKAKAPKSNFDKLRKNVR